MRDLVLAVDDSRALLAMVTRSVESLGYRALTARDGIEALGVLSQRSEEVVFIILDRNMTRMDGLNTLRCIKSNPRTGNIPVMMLTADVESVDQAVALGASCYVAKPISEVELTAYLKKVLPALEPRGAS